MTNWRNILLWLVGIVVAVYGAHTLLYPAVTFNYRLTIEAMTPNGARTGSGVIQVSYGSQFNLNGGGRRGNISVRGEAVYLDLGSGKNLFVTLTTLGSSSETALSLGWLPLKIYGFKWELGEEYKLAQQVKLASSKVLEVVPLSALPTIVTFRDLNDPKSVELVDPTNIADTFGEAYLLKSAIIEMTNDGISWNIRDVLSWLPDYYDKLLDGTRFTTGEAKNRIANELGAGAFDTRGK